VRCLNVNPSGTFNAVTAASLVFSPEPPRSQATPPGELDVALALGRLGGDRLLYRRLLRRFSESHGNSARDAQRALSEGDFERAALIVHTLSSAAANIGATPLQTAAQALENALRRRAVDTISGLLADFDLGERATQAAVASALDTPPPSSGSSAAQRPRAASHDNDTAAVDSLDELRELFDGQAPPAETFQRLEASVNAYDFAQARSHLDAFEGWLSSRPEEAEADL
jgi:HPt (histidine-containing phosphotransfer) domain-containing protein